MLHLKHLLVIHVYSKACDQVSALKVHLCDEFFKILLFSKEDPKEQF